MTWGGKTYGGDSSTVQTKLRGVETIYSTNSAFAAVLKDRGMFCISEEKKCVFIFVTFIPSPTTLPPPSKVAQGEGDWYQEECV